MQKHRFQPRMLEAVCEIWFTPGQPWRTETAQRIEAALPQVFPIVQETDTPFLWFEENYLSVRGGAPYCSQEQCRHRLALAIALYQAIAQPRAMESLSLHYQFEFAPEAVEGGRQVRSLLRQDRSEFLKMTLTPGDAEEAAPARLDISYLLTQSNPHCLCHPSRWLAEVHQKLDDFFHELRQGQSLVGDRK